jgi:hypothetical protein
MGSKWTLGRLAGRVWGGLIWLRIRNSVDEPLGYVNMELAG